MPPGAWAGDHLEIKDISTPNQRPDIAHPTIKRRPPLHIKKKNPRPYTTVGVTLSQDPRLGLRLLLIYFSAPEWAASSSRLLLSWLSLVKVKIGWDHTAFGGAQGRTPDGRTAVKLAHAPHVSPGLASEGAARVKQRFIG